MGILFFIGGIGLVISAVVFGISLLLQKLRQKGGSAGQAPANNGLLHEQLQAEKVQSDIILSSINDGVIVVDSDRIIRMFNPAAAQITGWPQEVSGLAYNTVIKLTDHKGHPCQDVDNPFEKVLEQGEPLREDSLLLVTKSNKTPNVAISLAPLINDDNEITGLVGVFRDITKERQAERQRAEFISTASHEMRTPVAAIEGYLALALNEKVSTIDYRGRQYLLRAHEATQHLGTLFQDLLTSARAEDGRISNHPVATEISSFLDKLVEDLRFAAQKKNLRLEYIVGDNKQRATPLPTTDDGEEVGSTRVLKPLYYVMVDPERLREIIINLFDNAVKYTNQGGISIGLTGDDDIVQIYVRDTGAGIATEDIPHLFQKFYRIDNRATRTIGGTGLGLFICRKIIELYNGRIWVESELNKGSTFYIDLPRISSSQLVEASQKTAKNAAATSQPNAEPNIIRPQSAN